MRRTPAGGGVFVRHPWTAFLHQLETDEPTNKRVYVLRYEHRCSSVRVVIDSAGCV
jgi:hypothetical protein